MCDTYDTMRFFHHRLPSWNHDIVSILIGKEAGGELLFSERRRAAQVCRGPEREHCRGGRDGTNSH